MVCIFQLIVWLVGIGNHVVHGFKELLKDMVLCFCSLLEYVSESDYFAKEMWVDNSKV